LVWRTYAKDLVCRLYSPTFPTLVIRRLSGTTSPIFSSPPPQPWSLGTHAMRERPRNDTTTATKEKLNLVAQTQELSPKRTLTAEAAFRFPIPRFPTISSIRPPTILRLPFLPTRRPEQTAPCVPKTRRPPPCKEPRDARLNNQLFSQGEERR
jgi:hypothetical protein